MENELTRMGFDISEEVARANRLREIRLTVELDSISGRGLLSAFVQRFGSRQEFAPIAKAITEFLGEEREAA